MTDEPQTVYVLMHFDIDDGTHVVSVFSTIEAASKHAGVAAWIDNLVWGYYASYPYTLRPCVIDQPEEGD